MRPLHSAPPTATIPPALRVCIVLCGLGLAAAQAGAVPVTRNLQFLAQKNDYPPAPGDRGYSACWSYVHADGREYAVIGATCGTAIYNIVNPAAPYLVGFIPGRCSTWREMKSYRDWIYVSTEAYGSGSPTPGLQIISMANPQSPVLVGTYATNFQTSHTVSVDTTRALLICNGTRTWYPCGGTFCGDAAGMRILSLAIPAAPVEIAWWPGGSIPVSQTHYVHDSAPVGNRLYASSIYDGIQRILDFTNPATPTQVSEWAYEGGFTHNSWPDATGNWLYVTDEVNGEPLKIFDISDPFAPALTNAITSNPQAIVHNAHVRGQELYLSNYTEGIRILDLSDPAHPAEFAWADSWPDASGGFFGVWEVCPYYPSGTVIASDMQTGLYVYQPVRDYGIFQARVTDQTGAPLADATVRLTTLGDSLVTPADGVQRFAPGPGLHGVTARRFGVQVGPQNRTIVDGGLDSATLVIPTVDFSGTVRDAVTLLPLDGSDVTIGFGAVDATDGAGAFAIDDVPDAVYTVETRRPGYIPAAIQGPIDATHPSQDFHLVPADTWDALETSSGWTVGAAGDNATSGIWTRVEPLGTGSPNAVKTRLREALETRPARLQHEDHEESASIPGDVQPETDRTPGSGMLCFVTGQGTDPLNLGQQDVDGGRTSVTTPALDMTGMTDPVIGYWRWLYANTPPDDWLAVLISNNDGASWVSVDTTRGILNRWEERAVHVASFVTPTTQVRVRFQAADLGVASLIEAAIDDLVTYDGATPAVDVGGPVHGRLAFARPTPNPSSGRVRLALQVPRAGALAVDVIDPAGRRVRELHRGVAAAGRLAVEWDGRDARGGRAAPGLYFVRGRLAGGPTAETRLVRVR